MKRNSGTISAHEPPNSEISKWKIWVDRGGTFTDLVACTPQGQVMVHKLLSRNPKHYQDATVQGIREVMQIPANQPVPLEHISEIKMGTTVVTNALLERKGVPTLLICTRGFKDVLRIGYQNRSHIFALRIDTEPVLYRSFLEVDERLGADGSVLKELDIKALAEPLKRSLDDGIRSVAISLMHGYKNPLHERMIAALAQELGFESIVCSHQISPLIRYVSRTSTTVLDAYLKPVLHEYVHQFMRELGASDSRFTSLNLMQSSGRLSDPEFCDAKDVVLSGPAGGVVGMVETALEAGFHSIIGFDMGGTSTDIAHYHQSYERIAEKRIAGQLLCAPMMDIHTIAAGGGSMLDYDGMRFQVGPESAGAYPGPACYRNGGPLTVTDCNVLLGRISPERFPHLFGPNGDQALDGEIVLRQFESLTERVKQRYADATLESVAAGFLLIAVENMVNAVKKISVQRGYDVTHYCLNCFGGAAGQVACMVADALSISTVYLHRMSGVLSALGIGLASTGTFEEQQLDAPLDSVNDQTMEEVFAQLKQRAHQTLQAQGILQSQITVESRLMIRLSGSDQSLPIAYANIDQVREQFHRAHQARYGFDASDQVLVIQSAQVEASGKTLEKESLRLRVQRSELRSRTPHRLYSDGRWHDAFAMNVTDLEPGEVVQGPCLLLDQTSTVVVDYGWQAQVDAQANLTLKRSVQQRKKRDHGDEVDPVLLEVFNNLFMSIAVQMGETLAKTAYSVNIKERLDFSCALFDAEGNLIANAPHLPVHLGAMGESVRSVIHDHASTIKPGNVYALNSPYKGGTHLPDITVVTPIFDPEGRRILFYVASRGHHADVGGMTPGSSPPNSTDIRQEGVVIENFLLVEQGRLRRKELRELLLQKPYPCRNPEQNEADLIAQIAANNAGVAAVEKMVQDYGLKTVHAYMEHVCDYAEESVRRVISRLNDGEYRYEHDLGFAVQVQIRIDQKNRTAVIDFSGSSPQLEGNFNAPAPIARSAVLYVFRALVNEDIPLNSGCLRPIRIILPPRSVVCPEYPAAVVAGNTEVSQVITDTLLGALGAQAGSQGTMNNFVYGNDRLQNYETICGGSGAGPDFDGAGPVQMHMTNTRMTDPEVLETRLPVRVQSFSVREDSGGKGRYQGGNGAERVLLFLEPMTVSLLSGSRYVAPLGLNGGGPGQLGQNTCIRADGSMHVLKGLDQVEVEVGDQVRVQTPGGGGYGNAT